MEQTISRLPTITDINNRYSLDQIDHLKAKLKEARKYTIEDLNEKIATIEKRWKQKLAFPSDYNKTRPKYMELKEALENERSIEEFIQGYYQSLEELLQVKKKILLAQPSEKIEFYGKQYTKPKTIYKKEIEEVGLGESLDKRDKSTGEYCGSCSVGPFFIELEDQSVTTQRPCDCRGCVGDGMWPCGRSSTETVKIKACNTCSFRE